MAQENLFSEKALSTSSSPKHDLGSGLCLRVEKSVGKKGRAILYRQGFVIKSVDLADATARRLFVVEAVELGAIKLRLAHALGISRQSIDNYIDSKHHFGVDGLIHSYYSSTGKSLRRQREEHADQRVKGNKTRQLSFGHP